MSTHSEHSAVTVLGLGPMGRALAGAFLDAGLRTTVWNRTPGRDGELIERGRSVRDRWKRPSPQVSWPWSAW